MREHAEFISTQRYNSILLHIQHRTVSDLEQSKLKNKI